MSRAVFCLLLCLPYGMIESALAQTDAPAPAVEEAINPAEVSALVRQLGSSKRQTRIEAEKKLAGFGPTLLDLLPSPDLIRSVAARQAVRRIRIKLEDEAAKLSLKPSRVTLRGSFAIAELARKIEQQTGNAIQIAQPVSPAGKPTAAVIINVDWKQSTFWEALQDLEMSGWLARFDADSGDLVLTHGRKAGASETKTERAFRFRSTPFQAKAVGGEASLLKNRVSIECEPRLRPLFLNYASDDFSLNVDGKTIDPFNAGAKIELPLGVSGREAEIQTSFLLDGKPASANLSGKVSLLLAAAERPIEFSDLGKAAGVARRRGGVTATVASVRLDRTEKGHSARILIRVSYDLGASAFESHQTWVFHNRVWIAETDKKEVSTRISANSFETVFQNETGVGVEYIFEGLKENPASMKFVYLAPTQLIRVPLKIDFEKLVVIRAEATQ